MPALAAPVVAGVDEAKAGIASEVLNAIGSSPRSRAGAARLHGPHREPSAGEGHRDEHMRTFFAQVAHVLPADDDLLLIGDGDVVEHFAEQVRADDHGRGRTRRIEVERGSPLTERQLPARTRSFAGSPAKRRLPR
jgi:hypothetical protein